MPHLLAPQGQVGDDRVLDEAQRRLWLRREVRVEEKLDGANVVLWLTGGEVRSELRAGAGSRDRAGQRGPLRQWAWQHAEALHAVLAGGLALYAEWLWFEHGTSYDALPDWLVGLDLWHPEVGLLPAHERDERLHAVDLVTPPVVATTRLGSVAAALALLGPSAFSSDGEPAEGLVLREGSGERCKLVRPGYRQRADAEWASGPRRNRLRAAATTAPGRPPLGP